MRFIPISLNELRSSIPRKSFSQLLSYPQRCCKSQMRSAIYRNSLHGHGESRFRLHRGRPSASWNCNRCGCWGRMTSCGNVWRSQDALPSRRQSGFDRDLLKLAAQRTQVALALDVLGQLLCQSFKLRRYLCLAHCLPPFHFKDHKAKSTYTNLFTASENASATYEWTWRGGRMFVLTPCDASPVGHTPALFLGRL